MTIGELTKRRVSASIPCASTKKRALSGSLGMDNAAVFTRKKISNGYASSNV